VPRMCQRNPAGCDRGLCGSGSCLTFEVRLLLTVPGRGSGRSATTVPVGALHPLVGVGSFVVVGDCEGAGMLRELRVSDMRCRAVLEVLDGAVIGVVARRYGVSRQTVRAWLRRYARDGAVLNLEDRSSRPHGCPHQMVAAVEARVLVLGDRNPRLGPTRIV
jgi:hypothetical protein